LTYALSPDGLRRIRDFIRGRALLAFDIDGTLAPIVAKPWEARIPDQLQALLAKLCARAVVAIVTGRAIADARRMLSFKPRYLIGNHGAEGVPGVDAGARNFEAICRGWLAALYAEGAALSPPPGIVVEDKTYSLALHYRHADDVDAARQWLEKHAITLTPRPWLIPGKFVVNLLPPGAPHKGDALLALLAHSGLAHAIYVGDDVTDEAVFRLGSPPVLPVCVAPSRDGVSDLLFLTSQDEIGPLLEELVRSLEPTKAVDQPVGNE
jgi:trehalose 6-phosphate phosphatase